MPPELGKILELWGSLSPDQKEAFWRFVKDQAGDT